MGAGVKATIGVDPGLTGALALIVDDVFVDVVDMPAASGVGTSSNRVQAVELADLIEDWRARFPGAAWTAIVEQVAAMPRQGVHSVFSLGHSLGVVEAVLLTSRVSVEWVTPSKWKRAMALGDDKAASRAMASRLYPDHSARWKRVKDDGRAEALLVAHWWLHRR